jgi:hypothetical protein
MHLPYGGHHNRLQGRRIQQCKGYDQAGNRDNADYRSKQNRGTDTHEIIASVPLLNRRTCVFFLKCFKLFFGISNGSAA